MKRAASVLVSVLAGASAVTALAQAPQPVTVRGGEVAVTVAPDGSVPGVGVGDRQVPVGTVAGGVFIRELGGTDRPADPVFEEGWEDGLNGWSDYTDNTRLVFTRFPEDAASGSWSIKARLDGATSRQSGALYSPPVNVRPGDTLRIQCRWKATRGYLGTDPGSQILQWGVYQVPPPQLVSGLELVPCDSDGTPQAGKRQHLVTFAGQAPSWRPAGAEWTVPPGVELVRVAITAVLDPAYGDEALLVDDIALFPHAIPAGRLAGTVTQAGDGTVRVEGTVGGIGLDVAWRPRSGGVEAAITAVAEDGGEHAFDLVLAVPVDATGWRWFDDWATPVFISSPIEYAFMVTGDVEGWFPVSVYPFGGVADAKSGLGVAVPMDEPAPVLIRYDAALRLLEVCWHVALAPAAGHGSLGVTARILDFDPWWGFRSLVERYRGSWRDRDRWFASPFDVTPFESFHRNDYRGEAGARRCAAEEADHVLSLQYTVPDLVVDDVPEESGVPPTLDELLALIDARSQQGSDCQQLYYGPVFDEVALGSAGGPVLKYLGIRPWTGGRLQAAFKLAPLEGEGGGGTWDWLARCVLLPAFASTASPDPSWDPRVSASTIDGVLLDNFGAHVTADLDPAHIAGAAGILTYSPADYRPAVFLPSAYRSHMERLRALVDALPAPARAVAINWKGIGIVNGDVALADILADETENLYSYGHPGPGATGSYAPWILRYRRALAFGKLRGTAFSGSAITRGDVEDTLATALLWATAARFKDETEFLGITAEEADTLCRAHNRLVARLQTAGWQPVTGASASDRNLLVERYGTPSRTFYLVVTNAGESEIVGWIDLDASLGVGGIERVTELVAGRPVGIGGEAPEWRFLLPPLGPRETALVEIVPTAPAPRGPSGRAGS